MVDLTDLEQKQGAVAALSLILQSRAKKLQKISSKDDSDDGTAGKLKIPKNIEEVEEDPGTSEEQNTDEEEQNRIERVKDQLSGKAGEQALKQIKQAAEEKKAAAEAEKQQKIQAKRDEMNRLDAQAKLLNDLPWGNINLFKQDLKKAIGEQLKIHKNPDQTFRKPNASYAGTKLMAPVFTSVEKRDKVIIHVYFDCSGSISEAGLDKAIEALAELDKFRKQGLCDFKVYYFANNVTPNRNDVYGATRAFPEILNNLRNTKAQNAIIITDDDFDDQTDFSALSQLELKGCVWWFWHEKKRAIEAAKYLTARRGTFQYNFY